MCHNFDIQSRSLLNYAFCIFKMFVDEIKIIFSLRFVFSAEVISAQKDSQNCALGYCFPTC